jgi:hypothetical protein
VVPEHTGDRALSDDLATLADLIRSGAFADPAVLAQ